mmetsp:Transcript_17906/g.69383  ORF Transcript_17906/g.69383 Transcript_17906/m.69383 type:complete len:432 (-) Transcript_17906:22-1317(-)
MGGTAILELLLAHLPRAAWRHRTRDGSAPLHLVCAYEGSSVHPALENCIAVLRMLSPEDLLITNSAKQTPLHVAASAGWRMGGPLLLALAAFLGDETDAWEMLDEHGSSPTAYLDPSRDPGCVAQLPFHALLAEPNERKLCLLLRALQSCMEKAKLAALRSIPPGFNVESLTDARGSNIVTSTLASYGLGVTPQVVREMVRIAPRQMLFEETNGVAPLHMLGIADEEAICAYAAALGADYFLTHSPAGVLPAEQWSLRALVAISHWVPRRMFDLVTSSGRTLLHEHAEDVPSNPAMRAADDAKLAHIATLMSPASLARAPVGSTPLLFFAAQGWCRLLEVLLDRLPEEDLCSCLPSGDTVLHTGAVRVLEAEERGEGRALEAALQSLGLLLASTPTNLRLQPNLRGDSAASLAEGSACQDLFFQSAKSAVM